MEDEGERNAGPEQVGVASSIHDGSARSIVSRGLADADAEICLTPVQPDDLPLLFQWINDRDLVALNGPYRPVSWAQHRAWFEEIQRQTDVVLFAIRLAGRDEIIGTGQLRSIHWVHRHSDLQIRIGNPSHRRKGFGTSALHFMLRFAFEDLNLNRVALQVFSDNVLAICAYEKVGFRREGVCRQSAFIAGSYVDTTVMAILRDEYAGRPR